MKVISLDGGILFESNCNGICEMNIEFLRYYLLNLKEYMLKKVIFTVMALTSAVG